VCGAAGCSDHEEVVGGWCVCTPGGASYCSGDCCACTCSKGALQVAGLSKQVVDMHSCVCIAELSRHREGAC